MYLYGIRYPRAFFWGFAQNFQDDARLAHILEKLGETLLTGRVSSPDALNCFSTHQNLIMDWTLYIPNVLRQETGSFIMPRLTKAARHIVFALSVRPCVRPTFCRHYSSETVRRSILILIHFILNILKLCTLVSICPSVCLFGQN